MSSPDILSSTIALLDAITAAVYNNTPLNNPIEQEITNFSFSTFKKNVPFHINDKRNDMLVSDLRVIGGCRLCKKTFLKHIEMIHHIVDHYPKQFYLFEGTITTTSLMDNDSFKNIHKNVESINKKEKILYNKNIFSLEKEHEMNNLGYAMCSICCQTFSTNNEYENHLKLHLMTISLARLPQTEKISYTQPALLYDNLLSSRNFLTLSTKKCIKCNQHFYSTFDHNLHMGRHNGYSYDCKDCGRCFETRKKLSFHNKSHKNRILPSKCFTSSKF